MHLDTPVATPADPNAGPWYKDLTRYHWFVFVVCAVGWMADCMDQQLFNLARRLGHRRPYARHKSYGTH